MAKVVDRLPQPFQTVSGRTTGPAVPLGRSRVGRGMPLYLHVSELRQAVKAFGWPTPEQHQAVADELATARAELDTAGDRIADLEAELEKAVAVLTLQFAPQKTSATGWQPEKSAA